MDDGGDRVAADARTDDEQRPRRRSSGADERERRHGGRCYEIQGRLGTLASWAHSVPLANDLGTVLLVSGKLRNYLEVHCSRKSLGACCSS